MKKRMKKMIGLALLAGVVMALGAASGVVPINASSGHWPVTAFLLDFAKRRSVDTHSFFIVAPPLDDPALVVKGAGHFESGCAMCHGSPAAARPKIPMGLRPLPPFLPERVSRWLPRELFYIVKHGTKFTGMPPWPAHSRDDEIWAMVAFLRTLPRMDAARYRLLALGTPADYTGAPRQVERCARCHGIDGYGREVAAFPRLAGQSPQYQILALQAYARDSRNSGIMGPIAATLNDEDMRTLADYYAGLAGWTPTGNTADPAVARGAEIAARGIPRQDVPPCAECHEAVGPAKNPAYPVLAGQFAEYLRLQLELFAGGRRGGSPFADIMRPIASRLTPDQMRDVAAYFASAPATRQTVFPTSSATSRPPRVSRATPTGRPIASPSAVTKPESTSSGRPDGRPPLNGTKITLKPLRGFRFHEPCWPTNMPC
jgi:cytochrome c553